MPKMRANASLGPNESGGRFEQRDLTVAKVYRGEALRKLVTFEQLVQVMVEADIDRLSERSTV